MSIGSADPGIPSRRLLFEESPVAVILSAHARTRTLTELVIFKLLECVSNVKVGDLKEVKRVVRGI